MQEDRSGVKAVLENTVQRSKSTPRLNFLTLLVGPSVTRHPHFLEPDSFCRDFRSDLRLKTEPILFQNNPFDNLSSEYVVTGFHVGKI